MKIGAGTGFGVVTPWLCRRCYCWSNYAHALVFWTTTHI